MLLEIARYGRAWLFILFRKTLWDRRVNETINVATRRDKNSSEKYIMYGVTSKHTVRCLVQK